MLQIYLIGYMGAGKTTIGRQLASKLSLNFIDLDLFIENRYSKTINQIFKEYGEAYFREIESNILKEIATFENVVISTGGGTPCFFDNIDVMKNNGITVYLETSPGILTKRLSPCKEKRPLIKDKNDEDLMLYIESNLKERIPFYEKSHLVFNTDKILQKEDVGLHLESLINSIEKQKQK